MDVKKDLSLSISKILNYNDNKDEIEAMPTKTLEKSLFLGNSNMNNFNGLVYENDELVKKYTDAINKIVDLEVGLDELMKNFTKTCQREADLMMANIQLESENHRLQNFLRVFYNVS